MEHYSAEDYDILCEFLDNAKGLYVTPNTLTETSNLVRQHRDPEGSLLMRRLEYLIYESQEITVASTKASTNRNFQRLELTDAVLLETVTEEIPLLTVDFSLYLAAIASGEERAINFTPYRNL